VAVHVMCCALFQYCKYCYMCKVCDTVCQPGQSVSAFLALNYTIRILISNHRRSPCSAFTSVTSTLEVNFNVVCSVNSRFTCLLTSHACQRCSVTEDSVIIQSFL